MSAGVHCLAMVAPFTGAWIEISRSLPTAQGIRVAPFTGAWIEISIWLVTTQRNTSRSLHGSVD